MAEAKRKENAFAAKIIVRTGVCCHFLKTGELFGECKNQNSVVKCY